MNLDKHKKRHARTVHIDVYCTESDSEDNLTSKSSDTLLDLSDVKINCKKISKKSHAGRSQSRMPSQSTLQRSQCLSTISSTDTTSNYSFCESSSCGLSSFMDSITQNNSSIISSEYENVQQKYQSKKYDTTSSSDDECSETAWSFNSISSQKNHMLARCPWSKTKNLDEDMGGSYSDCSQSPMFRQQPTNSNCETTQVAKMALKFGPTMRSSPKSDHHVGPSKNPGCSCYNCRRYFNSRHRSYSIGSEADQSDLSKLFKKCL